LRFFAPARKLMQRKNAVRDVLTRQREKLTMRVLKWQLLGWALAGTVFTVLSLIAIYRSYKLAVRLTTFCA